MSHRTFAAIWVQLQARTDIDNILRELIGQNSLESSLSIDSDESPKSSLRLIVFLKVIFDLQRTYSQCSAPSSESSFYLLQPKQLFLAIMHLLRIKSKILHRSQSTSTRYVTQRSFLAQVLVSGLRALWLRNCDIPKDDLSQLQQSLDQAWKGEELNHLDNFLFQLVNCMISDGLPRPKSELSLPACGQVQLRNHTTGLYPLEGRPDELVMPVKQAALCIGTSDWFRNYWILFDTVWTTEAALIQLCVDSLSSKSSAKSAHPTQDDIFQLHITRKKVLGTIFGSPTMKTEVKDSIAAILLTPYCGELCSCFEEVDVQQNHQDTASPKSPYLDRYMPPKPNMELRQILDESLPSLPIILESRKEDLRDCNREMRDLSDSLDDYMDAWYSEISSISLSNNATRNIRRSAYIVPCPNLHPIPYDILKGLIEHSDGKIGLKDLENNLPLIRIDISCSQCKNQYQVEWARKIEPLCRLSAIMTENLFRKPSNRREGYQEASYSDNSHRDSSGTSSSGTGSNSASLSEKKSSKQGQLTDFFDESPKKKNKNRLSIPSYSFSADGQSLLLWMKYGAEVVFYDFASEEPEKKPEKRPARDIYLAAAGGKFYAVISSHGNDRILHIYRRSDGQRVAQERIDVAVQSIALSPNDKFVALGFKSEAWIYEIEDKRIQRHQLPPMKDLELDSQRVCFSPDCDKVVVATRHGKGDVYTYASECTRPTEPHYPIVRIPTGLDFFDQDNDKDFGLTSVLYDNSGSICVTAFTPKTPPALLSLQNRAPEFFDASYHAHLGTQIQCAAQSPSGLKFVFVNNKNEVFSAQRHPNANWHVKKIANLRPVRKPIVMREDKMAIAIPNEDTIHLFWIKGREWMLMTI